ncbi:Mitochondrial ribosomal protein L37 isoform 1 [Quillaja saponaria]|uniref:Mitochondrial ribosomal protein L37 isoform 1 n=1 Tax=Quillaja saponaria TaxID=32244 RepID=A0AAD7M681_QUISA|nr:Mitochondrial ribosomal protein L37 isoform 1 [Quillaja saponaria]
MPSNVVDRAEIKDMAINHVRLIRAISIAKESVGVTWQRTFSAGSAKSKKGSKGGGASDAPKHQHLAKKSSRLQW